MQKKKAFNNNYFTAILLLIFFGFFGGLLFMLHWAAALGAYALVSPIVIYYVIQGAEEEKIIQQGVIDFDVYKSLVKKGRNGDGNAWIKLFKTYANAANDKKHSAVTIKDAIPFLEEALKLNTADAFFAKARLIFSGQYYDRDLEEAMRLLNLSVEKGSYDGLCFLIDISLGNIAECSGIEKYKDYNKGFRLCELSIKTWGEQPFNCFQYAECLYSGYGTTVNIEQAKIWFLKSQNLGFPYAKEALSEIYANEINQSSTTSSSFSHPESDESEIEAFFASEIKKK